MALFLRYAISAAAGVEAFVSGIAASAGPRCGRLSKALNAIRLPKSLNWHSASKHRKKEIVHQRRLKNSDASDAAAGCGR